MSAHFDVEQDNAYFFRISRRVFTMFTVLIGVYLTASTSAILMNNPSYMHDWRGVACIVLTVLALLIYAVQFRMSLKMDWPAPLRYAVGLMGQFISYRRAAHAHQYRLRLGFLCCVCHQLRPV
jgi:hypothetical protein